MSERREDLSTADLADQQPRPTSRPDLAEDAEVERREDRVRDDLPGDDLGQGPAMTGDRTAAVAPEIEPDRDRLEREEGEPAAAAAADERAQPAPDRSSAGTTTAGPLLAADDAEGFRARWTDVQNSFVDAPRQAVEQADGLVAELMQHLARTFSEERGRLESQWDRGDDIPTDDLRTAFQRYRSFFERLLAT
jgi:hypothetical protein